MNSYYALPPLPEVPFNFSILVTCPVRCNLAFSPVGAIIFPLASVDARWGSVIMAFLDLFTSFLAKRSFIQPPIPERPIPGSPSPNLTYTQFADLMRGAGKGELPRPTTPNFPFSPGRKGSDGPVGLDQPLFPDNLSVSLSLSAPFAPFDGSPDTSFNVPLFEVSAVPGPYIIALTMFIALFLIDQSGIKEPHCESK